MSTVSKIDTRRYFWSIDESWTHQKSLSVLKNMLKSKSQLMRDTLHENGDPFIFVVTLWRDSNIQTFILTEFLCRRGTFVEKMVGFENDLVWVKNFHWKYHFPTKMPGDAHLSHSNGHFQEKWACKNYVEMKNTAKILYQIDRLGRNWLGAFWCHFDGNTNGNSHECFRKIIKNSSRNKLPRFWDNLKSCYGYQNDTWG